MQLSPFLFVANWKAQKTYRQAQEFIARHTTRLNALMQEVQGNLVICPSAEVLATAHEHIKNAPALALGAQGCAPVLTGPVTGQVPVLSLVELKSAYCIIGHSEARAYGEQDMAIAVKAALLVDQSIIPIICVGETNDEYNAGKARQAVEAQLKPLATALKACSGTCLIAYEPQWAIGNGATAPLAHVQEMNEHIMEWTTAHLPHLRISILYGGSVSAQTIPTLRLLKKSTPAITGFLIGSASLELESLTNLIRLWYV